MPEPPVEGIVSLEPSFASAVSEVFRLLPSRFLTGRASQTLVYYFSIDEEKWTVTVSADRCEVAPGKTTEKADCFLKTSKEIFLATIRGDYSPSIKDLVSGRIKTNNPILLSGFRDFFTDTVSPPPG